MASGNMAVNINISKIMPNNSSASKVSDDKTAEKNSFKDAIKNESDKLNKKTDSKTDNSGKTDKTDKADSKDKLNSTTENDEPKETIQDMGLAQTQFLYGSFLINNKNFSVFANESVSNASDVIQQRAEAQSVLQVPVTQVTEADTAQILNSQNTTNAVISGTEINNIAQQLDLNNIQVVKSTDSGNNTANLNQMPSNENLQNISDKQNTVLNETTSDTGLSNIKTSGEQMSNTVKDVVIEQYSKNDNDNENSVASGFESALQTVQSTPKGDVIQFKVADVLPLNNSEAMDNLADKIIVHGNNEFDLQLEPENLGKIHVKLVFENGETKVSILCSTQKALEALNGSTDKLAAILENRTGNTTFVQVNQSEEQTYRQDYQQQNGNEHNYQGDERKDKRSKNEKSTDFLDQMRLGLV